MSSARKQRRAHSKALLGGRVGVAANRQAAPATVDHDEGLREAEVTEALGAAAAERVGRVVPGIQIAGRGSALEQRSDVRASEKGASL